MATSSESWSKTATAGSDIHDGESSPTSPESPALRQHSSHKLPSFYSLITCKSESLFSNSSHKTANNPASNNSTASISNTGDGKPARLPVLKQAKSVTSMKGVMWPSTSTGPSLLRSQSFTVMLRKKHSWPCLGKSDEVELQDSVSPRDIASAESPTGTPNTSIQDLERGGQGSRSRRTSKLKQLIYQSLSSSNHAAPTTDPSDVLSRLSTKRPTVVEPTPVRVVGEGFDSKRRYHTNPSPTSIASLHTIDTIIPVSEGVGSRPQAQPLSSHPILTPKMLKIRWRSRKNISDVGLVPTLNTNPLKLAIRKLGRANTLVSASDAKPTQLPIPPASPPNTTTIDLDSDPDSTPSPSLHLSLSNTSVPAAPQNKLEHTLGEVIPPSMLLAMNTGHTDPLDKHRRQSHDSSSSARSQRRNSIALSLLSLGSLMRVPRPLSTVHAGDAFDTSELGYEDDVCWVDNEYSSRNESAPTTPEISPIIFSVRPPSPAPPPRPKLVINPGSSVVHLPGMIAVSPESSVDSQYTNDDDKTQSESFTPATSPNDSGVPDTPLSFTGMCDPGSPISPIVFSEQAVESLDTASSFVPRLDAEFLGYETEISSSQMAPSNQRVMKAHSSLSTHSLSISSTQDSSSVIADLDSSPRKELPQGWSGEWNRTDVQDVIRSLREL